MDGDVHSHQGRDSVTTVDTRPPTGLLVRDAPSSTGEVLKTCFFLFFFFLVIGFIHVIP